MMSSSNRFLLSMLLMIWFVGMINWLLGYQLNHYGILPRQVENLVGIATAPFLHGGFRHLINNSISFLFLGWFVSLYSRNQLLKLTLFVAFWGGLLTWIMGRPYVHVGLSGVIFGYWGFITFNGFFEKSIKSILISAIAIFLYGGMAFGVLPSVPYISFESHLFGAASGILYSYLYCRKKTKG